MFKKMNRHTSMVLAIAAFYAAACSKKPDEAQQDTPGTPASGAAVTSASAAPSVALTSSAHEHPMDGAHPMGPGPMGPGMEGHGPGHMEGHGPGHDDGHGGRHQ